MKNVCYFALCGLVAIALLAETRTAYAVAPLKKLFESKYVKKDPTTDAEKTLLVAVKKAKCNVCHVGKKKKDHNIYGKALSELLTKKDRKDKEKLAAALETVDAMKSNPDDASSPTFGELIAQGKLPAGEPAEVATVSAEN